MAESDGELTVAQRLGRALDRGLLPAGGPAEAAERLIERLERPARLALLGLPGAGKSSILNLLVGTVVVPETLRLPTIVIQHGPEARMICTLTDGTSRVVPGSNLAEVLPLAPALVTMELDLPALNVISLLEVSAGPMEAEQRRAASWASKRADIVIWCTTSYLPKEQAVWESLPDSVKDNSFMFLTKVDLLGNRESAAAMHDRVEQRAGEEFRQILSISARQARAAMPVGGPVNRELFRDSGAAAVISAIKTRVQSGRRADMDTAELLLARHVEASELVARRFAEPGEAEPAAWVPPPEPQPLPADAPQPPAAEPEAEPLAAEPEDVAPEADAAEADPALPEPPEDEEPESEEAEAEEPEAEAAAPAPEAVVEEPEPEPEPAVVAPAPAAPEPELPEAEEPGRRRFADRIKRVAASPEPAAAPQVPLRSTWKSKAELEAPPEPEPARAPEPTRRPRAAPPAADTIVAPSVVEPEAPVPDVPAMALPDEPVRRERPAVSRERPASPPRPSPAEPSRTSRPNLFGGRRTSGVSDNPLPDLSALRAWPEADETAEESVSDAAMEAAELTEPEPEVADALPEPAFAPEPEPEPEPAPPPEPAPQVEPASPPERPRLFDRTARTRPGVATPPPAATPAAAPVVRLPAAARAAAPLAETREAPAAARPGAADEQFSPRAIMSRERKPDAEPAAPRRERPRIAARAVPASDAPAEPIAMPSAETALLDEAIALILSRSVELAAEVDPEAKLPVDLILDHARETIEQVMAVTSRARSDGLRRINGDVGEVLDLITLMQLEKGHAPADDALTLILQLRRELETLRAA